MDAQARRPPPQTQVLMLLITKRFMYLVQQHAKRSIVCTTVNIFLGRESKAFTMFSKEPKKRFRILMWRKFSGVIKAAPTGPAGNVNEWTRYHDTERQGQWYPQMSPRRLNRLAVSQLLVCGETWVQCLLILILFRGTQTHGCSHGTFRILSAYDNLKLNR